MGRTIDDFKNENYTKDQLAEIEEGLRDNLDVDLYADPDFLSVQMREIRIGLLEGLHAELYATKEYDWSQMEQIRQGLEADIKVSKYANPKLPFEVMREIRIGLVQGVDISAAVNLPAGTLRELRKAMISKVSILQYIKDGYVQEQLEEIRLALEEGLNIDSFLNQEFRGASIREIRLGLERKVDVSMYARTDMGWQQMREIRLGLEDRCRVSIYANPLYSWQQMREIRLGLEDNLPVERYMSFMHTANEMKHIREMLLQERETVSQYDEIEDYNFKGFSLLVSADEMSASLLIHEHSKFLSEDKVFDALEQSGVKEGIDTEAIRQAIQNGYTGEAVNIAHGKEAVKGEDGWYEYFFDTSAQKSPKLLEDGSVDYQNTEWFAIVKKGDKIAFYHTAQEGEDGITVTGKTITAARGKQLRMLTGSGFSLLPDHKTYIASVDGRIELKDGKIEVSSLLMVTEATLATGNINFNGSVHVSGRVGGGISIKATGDVLIEGFVESAVIEAGGNVIFQKGHNGAGQGYIKAKGDVSGKFFESSQVYAGGDIKANYCMNCNLSADGWIVISGKGGSLIGGSSYAKLGVHADQIGNVTALPTNISVGGRNDLKARVVQLQIREQNELQELSLLKNAYTEFKQRYAPEVRNVNPMFLKLENAVYTKEKELEKIKLQKKELEFDRQKANKAQVIVDGPMYEGVSVEINGAVWKSESIKHVTLRNVNHKVIASDD